MCSSLKYFTLQNVVIYFVYCLLTIPFSTNANQDIKNDKTVYTINISEMVTSSMEKRDVEAYLTSIYAPLGITPTFVYYPSKRGLNMVNAGTIDADASRFAHVMTKYTNTIQIPTPIAIMGASLFCTEREHCQLTYSDIRVGVLKGFLHARQHCTENKINCIFVDTHEALAKLLDYKRIDAALVQMHIAPSVICQSAANSYFYANQSAFEQSNFHYVHKSNSHLVEALSSAIAKEQSSKILIKLLDDWKHRISSCSKIVEKL